MKRLVAILTIFFSLLFNCTQVNAAEVPADITDAKIQQMKSDIDDFLGSGASGFFVWQFSGQKTNSLAADPYSFFSGSPIGEKVCSALKESADKWKDKTIGVNTYNIGNYDEAKIATNLDWIKGCGVKAIRIFASKTGKEEGVEKVLRVANSKGIKVIVAIADFNGDDFMPGGADAATTKLWYLGNYRIPLPGQSLPYQTFALHILEIVKRYAGAIYSIELSNEAHCRGDASTIDAYKAWGTEIAGYFSGIPVGYGQKASETTTRCDSASIGDFKTTNSISQISVTSAHFYTSSEKSLSKSALSESKQLGKQFYIGEAGYAFKDASEDDLLSDSETFCPAPIKIKGASPSCAKCGTFGEYPQNDQNILQNLFNGIIKSVRGGLTDYTFKIENITPLYKPNLDSENNPSNELGGQKESLLHTVIGANTDSNLDIREASKERAEHGDIKYFPQICTILSPEFCDKVLDKLEKKETYNHITDRRIYGELEENPSVHTTNLILPEKGMDVLQSTTGAVGANLWSPYGSLLSQTPPPGLSLSEYIGPQLAQKRVEYLAQLEKNYLAKNLSDEEKSELAFNIQDQLSAKNVQYNTENAIKNGQVSLNPNYNSDKPKIVTADALNFDTAQCVSPKPNIKRTQCTVENADTISITYQEQYDCHFTTSTIAGFDIPTGYTCDAKPYNLKLADYRGLFNCSKDVDDPSGFCPAFEKPSTVIKNVYKNANTALNNKYQLTANEGTGNSQYNIGATDSIATQWLAMAAPGPKELAGSSNMEFIPANNSDALSSNDKKAFNTDTINESLSGNYKLNAAKVGGTGGNLQIIQDITQPGRASSDCSKNTTFAIALPPKDTASKNPEVSKNMREFEKLTNPCTSTSPQPEVSYCGSSKIILNNNSEYWTTKNEAGVQGIIDPTSPLKIKLAVRFVSGAALIMSNGKDILGTTPGSNFVLTEKFAPSLEIVYLPDGTPEDKLKKDDTYWLNNGIRLRIDSEKLPAGPVNADIDINVKQGNYKLIFPQTPALQNVNYLLYPSTKATQSNGAIQMRDSMYSYHYFTLREGTSDDRKLSYCAKITRNSSMRGSEETYDGFGECKFNQEYIGAWNNKCGGNTATAEDPNFWKNEYKKIREVANGRDLYERIFGREFTVSGNDYTCGNIFPSTMYETKCEYANNQDINTTAAITANNGYNWVGGDADYFSKTTLGSNGIRGKGMYYNPGVMEPVVANRIKWNQIKPCPDCDGYGAMLRAGDIGRIICLKVDDTTSPVNGKVYKVMIADVAARGDINNLLGRDWVIDVDYNLGLKIGMYHVGPKYVVLKDAGANGSCGGLSIN